jgi:hypothetical protein
VRAEAPAGRQTRVSMLKAPCGRSPRTVARGELWLASPGAGCSGLTMAASDCDSAAQAGGLVTSILIPTLEVRALHRPSGKPGLSSPRWTFRRRSALPLHAYTGHVVAVAASLEHG